MFVPYYDENKSFEFVSWLFISYYDEKYLIITVYSSNYKDNDIYFLKRCLSSVHLDKRLTSLPYFTRVYPSFP